MNTLALALGVALLTAPALAQTQPIAPADAKTHVGETVTVEGAVSEVHHAASGKAIFIDIGGQYPDNAVAGVIFAADAAKFPNVDALQGKTIDVSGKISLYHGRPEIILNDASQIKAK